MKNKLIIIKSYYYRLILPEYLVTVNKDYSGFSSTLKPAIRTIGPTKSSLTMGQSWARPGPICCGPVVQMAV